MFFSLVKYLFCFCMNGSVLVITSVTTGHRAKCLVIIYDYCGGGGSRSLISLAVFKTINFVIGLNISCYNLRYLAQLIS